MISCFWQSYIQIPESTLMSILFSNVTWKERITMATSKVILMLCKVHWIQDFPLYNLNSTYYCNAISFYRFQMDHIWSPSFFLSFTFCQCHLQSPLLWLFTIQVWPLKSHFVFVCGVWAWCTGSRFFDWLSPMQLYLIFWPFLDSAPENWAPWFSYHKSFSCSIL